MHGHQVSVWASISIKNLDISRLWSISPAVYQLYISCISAVYQPYISCICSSLRVRLVQLLQNSFQGALSFSKPRSEITHRHLIHFSGHTLREAHLWLGSCWKLNSSKRHEATLSPVVPAAVPAGAEARDSSEVIINEVILHQKHRNLGSLNCW